MRYTSRSYWRYALFSTEPLKQLLADVGGAYLVLEVLDFFGVFTRDRHTVWTLVAILLFVVRNAALMAVMLFLSSAFGFGFSTPIQVRILNGAKAAPRLAATLEHQHIAQIHDFGRGGGTYYYTMEYLRGCDLRAVLARIQAGKASVDLPATIAIGIAAATGLHYAHEHRDLSGRHLGLVHRDVTPRNVIVDSAGHCRLLDFGIAARTGGADETGIFGSPGYMSPEQARSEPVDGQSDLFSLGAVLYEALTGKRAFLRENPEETKTALFKNERPRLRDHPEIPVDLATIIDQTLELAACNRPTSSGATTAPAWSASSAATGPHSASPGSAPTRTCARSRCSAAAPGRRWRSARRPRC